MRCYLINSKEQIVYSYDATDLVDARTQMRAKCLADGSTYALAVVVRRGVFSAPPPVPTVDDQAAP